jgi:RepB DNA-primase from phage plasmid
MLIQLDDLSSEKLARGAPVAFLTIETPPHNFQAWVALDHFRDHTQKHGLPEDFARRLRKGVGADLNASGSTRVAGSCNFKAQYATSFPP